MQSLKAAALFFTILAFVPSAAHLLELPGKLALPASTYFAVQAIYAGWAWFAAPIALAIALNLWLAARLFRRDRVGAGSAALSAILIGLSLVVFFVHVFPANQATRNWTLPTRGWEALRPGWEYGHGTNALLLMLAVILTIVAAVQQPAGSR